MQNIPDKIPNHHFSLIPPQIPHQNQLKTNLKTSDKIPNHHFSLIIPQIPHQNQLNTNLKTSDKIPKPAQN